MIIKIDNGHGINTPGKSSPDGQFREYEYTRIIAHAVVLHLQFRGYNASLLVPEVIDVPLPERVRRVNALCDEYGAQNVLLVSIHVNAAGKGDKWYDATGWSCYTSKCQTCSDQLADCLYAAAEHYLPGHRLRKDCTDGDPDIEADFTLLTRTKCVACLTENGFQDSVLSLSYLKSEEGKIAVCNLHVDGIISFINLLKNQDK